MVYLLNVWDYLILFYREEIPWSTLRHLLQEILKSLWRRADAANARHLVSLLVRHLAQLVIRAVSSLLRTNLFSIQLVQILMFPFWGWSDPSNPSIISRDYVSMYSDIPSNLLQAYCYTCFLCFLNFNIIYW